MRKYKPRFAGSLFKMASRCAAFLAILLMGLEMFAQSGNGVPGGGEYEKFSRFITDRNIFNPDRQPHFSGQRSYRTRTRTRTNGNPGIQLVGIMIYEKGPFAFFNASSPEHRKALPVGGSVAGYTITAITPDSVGMESADKKTVIEMKVGDGLLPEGTRWVFAKAGSLPTVTSSHAEDEPVSTGSSTGEAPAAPSAPSSVNEPNDVLRRLMQQREKENQ